MFISKTRPQPRKTAERLWVSLHAQKQEVLDVLDRLLGNQDGSKSAKIAALREVESAARRMADQVERHEANRVDEIVPCS
jgi:hypothetical protein